MNAVGVKLGNGWYSAEQAIYLPYGTRKSVILQGDFSLNLF